MKKNELLIFNIKSFIPILLRTGVLCIALFAVQFLYSKEITLDFNLNDKKNDSISQIKYEVVIQDLITGNVKDENGLPLPGVSIMIKGTSEGVQSDFNGNFQIDAKTGDILVFSYLGMRSQNITILSHADLSITMELDTQALDQVIVVAYGTTTKEDFTGSVSQITAENIDGRAITNPISALEGTAPGVQFAPASGQPGGTPEIQIRGIGSVNANRLPLYIVDGTVFSGDLSSLNAQDIESMSVLKDASSTALYGNKAANGVVIITTKKGRSKGGTFTFDISQGLTSRSIPEYDRVNAKQYYPLQWEAYRNSLISDNIPIADANRIATGLLPRNDDGEQLYEGDQYDDISQILGYNPFNVPSTSIVGTDGQLNPSANLLYPDDLDWQDPLTRAGSRSNTYFSYAGASEQTDYFLSIGHLREEGYIIKSDFERLTARINLNTKIKEWGKVGLNLSGATATSNQAVDGANSSTSFVNPFFTTRRIGPIYPVFLHDPITGDFVLDKNGNHIYDSGDIDQRRASGAVPGRHVIQETLLNVDRDKINSISARTFGEIYFLKDFTFTFNASLDKRFFNNEDFDNPIVGDGNPDGRAGRDATVRTAVNYNQLLNYKKIFGKHSVEGLLGHESFDYEFNFLSGFRQVQVVEGNTELINFTTTVNLESFTRNYNTEGYLSRLNYDFGKRYYLSASYRRDASSRFSKKERWGNFFSFGGAWRIDQEQFMQNVDWINQLKIRTSYGEVGNDSNLDIDPIDFYVSQALFSLNKNNALEPGIQSATFGNQDLTWETNRQKDIALEFGFLDNRISGTLEYYERESDDLLFEVPKPVASGLDDRIENIGAMVNQGVEVDLSLDLIRNDNFTWNFSINAATIKNEFKKLPQEEIITGTKKLVVGGSIFDFWRRDWYGVDSTDGSGLYVADDVRAAEYLEEIKRNDPVDDDLRLINNTVVTTNQNKAKFDFVGSAIPDVYGSFRNTFQYQGFSFSTLFAYQLGGKTYDTNYAGILSSGTYGTALHEDILTRWQKPGDITDVPRLDNSQIAAFGAASDRWLVDSDFLSIRQVNFSYQLPENLMSGIGIKNGRIYVNAENLWVFTKRKGLDVNQNFNGTTQNRFTPARIITLGLNVTF